ncbi:MAG TPA: hypothetical protein VFG87_13065 [Amycolatopsis sp.]|jgi:hypothetical protein|nr:hypothetical protein [Amycolatopsis sp.]
MEFFFEDIMDKIIGEQEELLEAEVRAADERAAAQESAAARVELPRESSQVPTGDTVDAERRVA